MPTKIKIIHAHDFIKVTPEGELDFEESKRLLQEVVSFITPDDDCMILLDTRTVHSVLLPIQLWYLALEISKLGVSSEGKLPWYARVSVLSRVNFSK